MSTKIERGNTKKVTVFVRDENDNLIDPDGALVYISVKYLGSGETVLEQTPMVKNSTGNYYYYWETSSSYELGQYLVEFSATYNSKPFVHREVVELVEWI